MSVYEYQCSDQECLFEWELEQKMTDTPSTECPKCRQNTAKRLISLSSFALKGGGWASSGYSG